MFDLFTVLTFALMGSNCGCLSTYQGGLTIWANGHYVVQFHTLALLNKKVVSPKNDLSKAVESINFIKPWTLSTRLFDMLCDIIENIHKTLLLHGGEIWLSWEKNVIVWIESFFMKYYFTWKIVLFRLRCLADILLKMNWVKLSLQGKQLKLIFANDTIQAFKWILEFWASCIYHHKLDNFPVLKDVSHFGSLT